MNNSCQQQASAKKESLLVNLGCNILIPTLILTNLSTTEMLGVTKAIVLALAFPLLYGVRDLMIARRFNLFSGLGILSVLLTGGISLMRLDPFYIAIKEASIPAIFGLATVLSLKTPWPLVHTFLYNDKLLNTEKITRSLNDNGNSDQFDSHLVRASWLIAGSFFLSSILNFALARILVHSDPGTVAFNEELGKMTALSFPVIAFPAMLVMIGALVFLFRGIKRLTGLSLEEVVHHRQK